MRIKPAGSGGNRGSPVNEKPVPFKLYVDTEEYSVDRNYSFGPFFPPSDFTVTKKRNLKKDDNVCEGETVTDNGSKNRVIFVSGILSGQWELHAFEQICDLNKPLEVNTMGAAWEGEVRVEEGEYHGPVGKDTRDLHRDANHWKYTLQLVSTGRDEYDNFTKDGILEEADSS